MNQTSCNENVSRRNQEAKLISVTLETIIYTYTAHCYSVNQAEPLSLIEPEHAWTNVYFV